MQILKNIFLKYDILSLLFLLLGVFSTWSALIISVGGTQLAFYNLILVLIIALYIYKLFKNKSFSIIVKDRKILFVFFFLLVISTLLSRIHLGGEWFSGSLRGVIKFLFLLFPFACLFNDDTITDKSLYFKKGLYYSALGQLFWLFLQIILWSNFRLSLNEYLFGDLLNISSPGGEWTYFMHIGGIDQFRPTGLGWDTSAMGFVLIIGYLLSKTKYEKIGFVIGILLSTSRTAIISLFLCILAEFVYDEIFKHRDAFREIFQKYKKHFFISIAVILVVFVLFILFMIFNKNFANQIIYIFFNSNDELGNFSAQRHADYYLEIPLIFMKSSLLQILFGYGTFIAGFPYAVHLGFYKEMINWTPESDFITLLFGNGVIGCVLYYWILIRVLIRNIKDRQNFLMIIALFIAGFFYLYIRGSCTFMLILMLYPKKNIE